MGVLERQGQSPREYSCPFGPQVAIDDISIVASDGIINRFLQRADSYPFCSENFSEIVMFFGACKQALPLGISTMR
jgi:hypothetical protein